jgi:hypothetical protein
MQKSPNSLILLRLDNNQQTLRKRLIFKSNFKRKGRKEICAKNAKWNSFLAFLAPPLRTWRLNYSVISKRYLRAGVISRKDICFIQYKLLSGILLLSLNATEEKHPKPTIPNFFIFELLISNITRIKHEIHQPYLLQIFSWPG